MIITTLYPLNFTKMKKPTNYTSKIQKVKKVFEWKGFEFKICIVLEKYMNSIEEIETVKVIAANGAGLPLSISKRTSLQDIEKNAKELLNRTVLIIGEELAKSQLTQIL